MPLGCISRFLLILGLIGPVFSLRAGTPVAGAEHSPAPETVALKDAWRLAEAFAAQQPGREVVVGRGDSMLPLYRDRTVLVLEPLAMSDWRAGMTVVFVGDSGRPVAHTLVKKTRGGWIAAGLANPERDRTLVRAANYIGTVVRAFEPEPGILHAGRMVSSVARSAALASRAQ